MMVFGVYRNEDMTEGRGAMVLDRLYMYEEHAWNYANRKPGVMGRGPKWRGHTDRADGSCPGWQCASCWGEHGGDWQVRKLEVIESEFLVPEETRAIIQAAREELVRAIGALRTVNIPQATRDKLNHAKTLLAEYED